MKNHNIFQTLYSLGPLFTIFFLTSIWKWITIGIKQTFFQRRHPSGQHVYKTMLNITSVRDVQSKTTVRFHLTSFTIADIMTTRNTIVCENSVIREHLYTRWKCKLVKSLWKPVWWFLQKLKKKNCHVIQQFHFWVYIQKDWNLGLEEIYQHTLCS